LLGQIIALPSLVEVARAWPDDAGSEVADTASWLEICAGWPVIDTDGMKVGLVQRVLGDRDTGEFEGIDVAVNSATPTIRVPPASISVIDAGEVKLSVRRAELAR
jgi:sporulation protein YlmC with PRC-barrel domain